MPKVALAATTALDHKSALFWRGSETHIEVLGSAARLSFDTSHGVTPLDLQPGMTPAPFIIPGTRYQCHKLADDATPTTVLLHFGGG